MKRNVFVFCSFMSPPVIMRNCLNTRESVPRTHTPLYYNTSLYFSLLPSRTDLTCSDQEEFRQRELRASRLAMEIESQNMVSNYQRHGDCRGDAVCLCVFCRIDMASMTQGLKRKRKCHCSPSLFLLLSVTVIELFALYSRFSAVVRPPAVMTPPSLPPAVMTPPSLPQEYVLR